MSHQSRRRLFHCLYCFNFEEQKRIANPVLYLLPTVNASKNVYNIYNALKANYSKANAYRSKKSKL